MAGYLSRLFGKKDEWAEMRERYLTPSNHLLTMVANDVQKFSTDAPDENTPSPWHRYLHTVLMPAITQATATTTKLERTVFLVHDLPRIGEAIAHDPDKFEDFIGAVRPLLISQADSADPKQCLHLLAARTLSGIDHFLEDGQFKSFRWIMKNHLIPDLLAPLTPDGIAKRVYTAPQQKALKLLKDAYMLQGMKHSNDIKEMTQDFCTGLTEQLAGYIQTRPDATDWNIQIKLSDMADLVRAIDDTYGFVVYTPPLPGAELFKVMKDEDSLLGKSIVAFPTLDFFDWEGGNRGNTEKLQTEISTHVSQELHRLYHEDVRAAIGHMQVKERIEGSRQTLLARQHEVEEFLKNCAGKGEAPENQTQAVPAPSPSAMS